MDFFQDYMPHIHCYLGDAPLTWTMATTDALIGIAYMMISISLYRLVRSIQLPFSGMFIAFGLFIFACGATHFMELYTLWVPAYWVSAALKTVTAGASIMTALHLIRMRTRFIAFATGAYESQRLSVDLRAQAEELREANAALYRTRDELRVSYEGLERRVDERTHELAMATERLELAIDVGRIGIWERDLRSDALILSDQILSMLEIKVDPDKSRPTFTFETFLNLIHPDDRQAVQQNAEHAIKENKNYAHEYRVVRPNGDVRWVQSKGRSICDDDGHPIRFSGVMIDISATKASEDALRDLANSVPQLAWTADDSGRITWYNQRWYEYTGSTPEQMHSADGWRTFYDPQMLPEITRCWHESIATGKTFEMEFPIRGADGQMRWFLTRAAGVRDERGKLTRWFGTNTDIDDRARIRAELELAKNAAENANQLKTAFLANMSHEIRTPLGAILGFADLLKDSTASEVERGRYLDIILRNGSQLLEIINDILDVSKVESNQLKIECVECNIPELVEETASLLRERAKEKGISLDVISKDAFPPALLTDPIRLKQILMNIINNAVKFTHVGGVRIELHCTPVATEKADVSIHVVDTGIGIPRADQAKLFEPFVQADNSISRRYGGTGLGLALSQRLANLLGGDLKLDHSDPNRGSSFSIALRDLNVATPAPERGASPAPPSHKAIPRPERALEGRSILIVDDSTDNQHLISRLLTKQGARVDLAANGAEGVTMALKGDHDLVFMDIAMPVLDGYAATSRLRERGYRKPIIALTAHAMSGVRAKCLNVGYDDHLTKPVNATDLIDKARKFIER